VPSLSTCGERQSRLESTGTNCSFLAYFVENSISVAALAPVASAAAEFLSLSTDFIESDLPVHPHEGNIAWKVALGVAFQPMGLRNDRKKALHRSHGAGLLYYRLLIRP